MWKTLKTGQTLISSFSLQWNISLQVQPYSLSNHLVNLYKQIEVIATTYTVTSSVFKSLSVVSSYTSFVYTTAWDH